MIISGTTRALNEFTSSPIIILCSPTTQMKRADKHQLKLTTQCKYAHGYLAITETEKKQKVTFKMIFKMMKLNLNKNL